MNKADSIEAARKSRKSSRSRDKKQKREHDIDIESSQTNPPEVITQSQKSRPINLCAKVSAIILFIGVLSIVPSVAFTAAVKDDVTKDKAFIYSAASFAIIATLLSSRSIFFHMSNWYKPKIQKYTLVILFMPPIWAAGAFVSIKSYHYEEYLNIIIELYECAALVSILMMFISILGGGEAEFKDREKAVIEILKTKDESYGRHTKCFVLCFSPWDMGEHFYYEVKWGILQVIILKLVFTATSLIFVLLGYYNPDGFAWNNAYTYVTIFGVISMVWSFYSLKMFYYALSYELKHPIDWHPVAKIACFKGIVILSMLQGKILSIFVAAGVITEKKGWNVDHVTTVLQNFFICIEMCFLSVINNYVFPHTECLP